MTTEAAEKKFTIFRGEDATSLGESGAMHFEPFKEAILPFVGLA